jgi:hypothetical protein
MKTAKICLPNLILILLLGSCNNSNKKLTEWLIIKGYRLKVDGHITRPAAAGGNVSHILL